LFPGGIEELNNKYKNLWRSIQSGAMIKHYSRLKIILAHVHHYKQQNGKSTEEALAHYDNIMRLHPTVSAMEKFLQKHYPNVLKKRSQRKQ
jgi:hypothetical protein